MRLTEIVSSGELSTVGDIAARHKYLAFEPDQYIKFVIPTMQVARCGAAGVVDHGKLVGVITERDVLRRIFQLTANRLIHPANVLKNVEDMTVRDVMIAEPRCLDEHMDIENALELMTEIGFRFMPVISPHDRHKLIGIVDEREVAIHVKNRLDNVKRNAAAKESLLHHLFSEPYGVGFSMQE